MSRISFINIGNELLKGTIVNTNASNAGLILRKSGLGLHRVVMISDQGEAIREALEEEMKHSEVVLMSGGLGPTKDDITKYTLSEYFGGGWKTDRASLDIIKQRFEHAGLELNSLTADQARVPESCEVILNRRGTAPGMLFQKNGSYVFAMPGVPYEMLFMLEKDVIPRIQQLFPVRPYHAYTFRLAGVPESEAASRMEDLEEELPQGLQVAYLPRLDGLWLELSVQEEVEQVGLEMLRAYIPRVRAIFADKIYVEGDEAIAKEVQDLFLEKGLTLAVAESITGGRIGAKLVEIPGSSGYFKGGIMAYDKSVKISHLSIDPNLIDTHGVVSEQIALAMAEGVRKSLGADIGIATTGYVEKGENHNPEVWIGMVGEGIKASRYSRLRTIREINLERTAYYALQLCLKKLREAF